MDKVIAFLGTIVTAVFISSVMSGCSVGWTLGDGVSFAGSPEGIQAFYDGQNALIANAITQDPNGDSAAWQFRNNQEKEKTVRKGFFQKITGGQNAS